MTGIIDTGFTGFVQVPSSAGIALGLLTHPFSVGGTSLANGAVQKVILKLARVAVSNETRDGICHIPLTASSPNPIGMDFLRRFARALVVSCSGGIHLVPDQFIPQP